VEESDMGPVQVGLAVDEEFFLKVITAAKDFQSVFAHLLAVLYMLKPKFQLLSM
jgi:hypothetical protein